MQDSLILAEKVILRNQALNPKSSVDLSEKMRSTINEKMNGENLHNVSIVLQSVNEHDTPLTDISQDTYS